MSRAIKRPITKKRTGHEQTQFLISYMEEHSLFARGQVMKLGPQGHIKYQNMWSELSTMLNNIGPCYKNVAAWQESWKKLRLESKQRKAAFMLAYNRTGHINPNVQLKDNDERITAIFGKYGTGLPIFPESGFSVINDATAAQVEANMLCNIDIMYNHHHEYYDSAPELKVFAEFEKKMLYETHRLQEELHMKYFNSKRTMSKPTAEQKNAMLEFMENHVDFACNASINDPLWLELISFLHGLGPERSLKAWQKTWTDYVRSAHQTFVLIKQTDREEPLSDFYYRIIKLTSPEQKENSSEEANKQSLPSEDVTPAKVKKTDFTPIKPYTTESLDKGTSFENPTITPNTAALSAASSHASVGHTTNSPIYHGTQSFNITRQNKSIPPVTYHDALSHAMRKSVASQPMSNQTLASQPTSRQTLASRPKGTTSCTSTVTSSSLRSTSPYHAETPQRKAVTLFTAFQKSQENIITTIERCFEKQNKILSDCFHNQQSTLLMLPNVIAEEVDNSIRRALNSVLHGEAANQDQVGDETDHTDDVNNTRALNPSIETEMEQTEYNEYETFTEEDTETEDKNAEEVYTEEYLDEY